MMRAALLHPLRFTGDHRYTRAHASEYVDDELDTSARARVEGHAHVCPPCMRFLSSLRRTVSALQTLGSDSPAPRQSVADGVISRLRDAEPRADADHSDP